MAHLDDDLRDEYTQLFTQYSKNGRITSINEFAAIMQAIGQIVPPMELKQKLGTGLDANGFIGLMTGSLAKEDTDNDIEEAFKVFDKDGSGTIQMTELRFVLCVLGDKLDSDQAEEISGRISTVNGAFDYRKLIQDFK